MKNDLQNMNILGDVESFSETTYNITSDEDETTFEQEDTPTMVAEFLINEDGNITHQEISIAYVDSCITTDCIYNGTLKAEEIVRNPDGRTEKTVLSFDDNGLAVHEVYYRDDNEYMKSNMYYDELLQLSEIESLYTTGVQTKQVFKYDDNGNKIEEIATTKVDFTSTERTTYTYDEHNDLVESISYEPDGSVQMATQYKYDAYDETGNWTEKTECMDEIPIRKVVRTINYRK